MSYNPNAGGSASWSSISGKPSTFPPEAHTQAISTITGLQTALDGKQAAGSYAAASHTHTAADVTDFTEAAQDVVGAMVTAAGGSYNDGAGTITLPGGGSDPWSYIKLGTSSTVSTVAYANVTGMAFTATANATYLIQVFGAYQTAATTTGIGLTLDIPSGSIIGQNIVNTSATALGGTEIIADAASTGATTGVRAASTNTPISAFFVVAVGATGGAIQLMQRSEVAGSNTTLQGSLTIMGYRAV